MDTPTNKEMADALVNKEQKKARRRELYQLNKEYMTTKQKVLYHEYGGKEYKAQYYQIHREKLLKYNTDKYQNRIKLATEVETE